MVEALVEAPAMPRLDDESHAARLADGVQHPTRGAHGDVDIPLPGAPQQRLQLVAEIIPERQPRIEGAFVDFTRFYAQFRQVIIGLVSEPVDQALVDWRYFDAGDVGQHRRVVPAGAIRRAAADASLLLENGESEGPRSLIDQRLQRVDGGRAGADEGD